MLVLTRKTGEEIRIDLGNGRELVVTLIEAKNGKARLGFSAPREVQISRAELLTQETKA
jgi:carbon storage regulator CsrA